MRFRWLNRLYASVLGFFWTPCPLCGQMFGGHEWHDGNSIVNEMDPSCGHGVCPDCKDHPRVQLYRSGPRRFRVVVK